MTRPSPCAGIIGANPAQQKEGYPEVFPPFLRQPTEQAVPKFAYPQATLQQPPWHPSFMQKKNPIVTVKEERNELVTSGGGWRQGGPTNQLFQC